jgi:hypothetical protein
MFCAWHFCVRRIVMFNPHTHTHTRTYGNKVRVSEAAGSTSTSDQDPTHCSEPFKQHLLVTSRPSVRIIQPSNSLPEITQTMPLALNKMARYFSFLQLPWAQRDCQRPTSTGTRGSRNN